MPLSRNCVRCPQHHLSLSEFSQEGSLNTKLIERHQVRQWDKRTDLLLHKTTIVPEGAMDGERGEHDLGLPAVA
jgi:hypothetical protein